MSAELVPPEKVLFIGMGKSAVCWYRCALPATFMGADWIGLYGEPPNLGFGTGLVRGQTMMAPINEYDIVVIQQPRGKGWLRIISELRDAGRKVYFEIDDYVHAIRKMKDHDYKAAFEADGLADLELNMRVCDGIICSTEYIARRYKAFNPNTIVCENGLDVGRYRMTRPPRNSVNIGWAGATGHKESVMAWLQPVGDVMARHPETIFVSIGMNFADMYARAFPGRTLAIPFTLVDQYPAAMTMFDIALAPAGKGNFFRGKSDLRWLEAGALGVPVIADPVVYPKITHGVDGFHAHGPQEAESLLEALLGDADLRTEVGENAKKYVYEKRSMHVAVRQWTDALGIKALGIKARST